MAAKTKPTPKQPSGNTGQFVCDEKGCKYSAKSKGAITAHWNKVHRKPNARKRGNPRRRNQDQGRPTVLTPQVIAKLVAAFQNGLTKKQAFRYAGVSKDAYYDNIKSDQDFADKMRDAQEHLNFKSREVIAKAIEQGSDLNARWWLERKQKDEFSPRKETTGSGGGPIKTKDVGAPEVVITKEELHEALFG